MTRVAFVGATPGSLADRVRRYLTTACELLQEGRAKFIAENIDRITRGEPPRNLIA